MRIRILRTPTAALIAALVPALLLCGCGKPAETVPQPATQDAQTNIQDLAAKWVKAYNDHDRGALAALYEANAELMMHGGPTIKGQGPIGEFWARDFKEGNPLTLLTVTHAVDGSDMILVHGNYEVVGRDGGDKLGMGRFAHIWLKDAADNWKLDRDLWVMQSPPNTP